jgi:hypothetical protein
VLRCALERLSEKGIPPSRLRLRGLLRHLARAERWWFRQQFADEEVLICTTRIMTNPSSVAPTPLDEGEKRWTKS